MKNLQRLAAFLVFLLTLSVFASTGCKKDEGGDEESGSEEEGGEEEDNPLAGNWVEIELAQLDGLKISVPEGSEPSPMGGDLMIMAMEASFTVGHASASHPQTLDAAKSEATELYSATNIEEETLEDGWALTFVNEGSLGTNYWVQVRREIGGTAYWCQTSIGYEMQADGALRACKSMHQ